jgi:glycerol-3-phosphate dehydrogenase subunit B
MTGNPQEHYDLAVVGAGMAGMATALFAAERGLRCIEVGNGGGLLFASGLLDLCGVHPVAEGRVWPSPFDALAALARDEPGHPLARIDAGAIEAAFAAFVAALGDAGLPYAPLGAVNHRVLTSIGTVKTTFGVPRSMIAGATALAERPPCLLVDFRGLREFSARQIVAALGDRWPGLAARRIDFPGTDGAPELYAAHVARALESGEVRERTIALVRPLLGDARAVGFPAVLGLRRAAAVHAAFESALGVPVFEIPTMPTSVPGLRLVAALEVAVATRGVDRRHQARVRALSLDPAGEAFTLEVADAGGGARSERVSARAVVLATGRFAGRGLTADRTGVRESLTGLPVRAPASRDAWHRRDFLDARGHPINRVGLAVDAGWRVLGADGVPVSPRLHAVGSILAGQDWGRTKCGAGLSIATAWAATEHAAAALGGTGAARA